MLIALWLAAASWLQAGDISGQFVSTLTTGSLAGLRFPVTFSYDGGQVNPSGDSFITLNSIDFTLLGVAFAKENILQGGQAILHNGVLQDVTASFQGPPLPPNSPVENITFGFGGNGVIGYADLNGQFGNGSFTFVPEHSPMGPIAACSITRSSESSGAGRSEIRWKCTWRMNRRK
jgi:hypothetical protein